jgi:hypothetical protein
MHKYYTEKYISARLDKKISGSNTSGVLKNQKQGKDYKSFGYTEPKKIDKKLPVIQSQTSKIDIENLFRSTSKEKLSKLQLFDELFYKISTAQEETKKVSPKSEKDFKRTVTKNIKGLAELDIISEKEQKEMIKHYDGSEGPNMFTTTKFGLKYRNSNLKKTLSKAIQPQNRIDYNKLRNKN